MSSEEIAQARQEIAELRAALAETNERLDREVEVRRGLESFVAKLHTQLYDLTQNPFLSPPITSLPQNQQHNVLHSVESSTSFSSVPTSSPKEKSSTPHQVSFSPAPEVVALDSLLEEKFKAFEKSVEALKNHFSKASNQKEMAVLGDDSRNRQIVQLVRGDFCTSLIELLYHGFISTRLIGRYHLWDFFEAASEGFSRSENQVLQTIASGISVVNVYERMKRNQDMKTRSLVCYGLNYRQLHEWVNALAPPTPPVSKWFEQRAVFCDANVRNRVVQLLKPLSAFPYVLAIDFEISALS